MKLRISFDVEELEKYMDAIYKSGDMELLKDFKEKIKKHTPDTEAREAKTKAGMKARGTVERRNIKRIEVVLDFMKKDKDTKITVSSVAKEAKLAYNTVKKYKTKIEFAEADRIRSFQ